MLRLFTIQPCSGKDVTRINERVQHRLHREIRSDGAAAMERQQRVERVTSLRLRLLGEKA